MDAKAQLFTASDFTKIVLSRKGLDSGSGYGYSRFDPETGRYIWVPIPMTTEEQSLPNSTRYEDVQIRPDYLPGIHATNLRELIEVEELGYSRKTKEVARNCAHVDPWLGPCPWLADASNHPVGAFGQSDKAQKHLGNRSVGEGSLFLFYSRFVPIIRGENRMGIPAYKKGAYFLYGWLKVGEVADCISKIGNETLKQRHPHATDAHFSTYPNTRIYLPARLLSDTSRIEGCGYFPTLCKELLLSSPEHDHLHTPSVWKLPAFFGLTKPTYIRERRWVPTDGGAAYFVWTKGRGQEFVFDSSPEFAKWFSDIVKASLKL